MIEQEAIDSLKNGVCSYEVQNHNNISLDTTQECIDMAISALEKQINGGWIPCSERLPLTENKNQKRVAVIVTTDTGFIETMYYEFENKMFWTTRGEYNRERWKYDRKDFKVLAWMPLLTPYKEDRE